MTTHQPVEAGEPVSRTNSVQRMLELERRIRIERMQTTEPGDWTRAPRSFSITTRTSSIRPSRNSSMDSRLSSRTDSLSSQDFLSMKGNRRSGIIPSFQITLPKTKNAAHIEVSEDEPTVAGIQKTVTFLSPGGEVDLEPEAASSICHSPSWENYGQRKRDRKLKEAAERDARAARKGGRGSKLTKAPPRPPPSASRTPLLANRRISVPLLPGHYKQERGRSVSTQETPSAQLAQLNEPKPRRRKGGSRSRSESLGRRIRSSLEIMRGEGDANQEKERGFVGGLKLHKERKAEVQNVQMPSEMINQQDASAPNSPIAWSMQQHSAHSTGVTTGGSPPTTDQLSPTSADNPDSMSPHPLRHKGPPVVLRARSLHGQPLVQPLVSPTMPPVPDLALAQANLWQKDSRSWEAANGRPSHGDDSDAQHQEVCQEDCLPHLPEHNKHSPMSGSGSRSGSGSGSGSQRWCSPTIDNDTDDPWTHPKPGYPPSRAYSMTMPAEAPVSPTSRGRTSSLARTDYLGSLDQHYTPPTLHLRSPVDDQPQQVQKPSRSSTIRSFRDAALGVFSRRSSSRAPSRTRGVESERASMAPSPSEYSSTDGFCPVPKPARVLGGYNDHTMRPPPVTRPSDHSSVSSYEDSLSQPSSVTTPDTSRPQSEKSLNAPAGDAEKVLGGDEKPSLQPQSQPQPQEIAFAFPSTPTPPLGPKSSKRPLSGKYEFPASPRAEKSEKTEDELWSRSAMPADIGFHSSQDEDVEESNFSHASLIPKPLTVSPRSSVQATDEELEMAERPSTGLEPESEAVCDIERHPSLSKSRSSPQLQILDTSFLPKLKHQSLQPRTPRHQKRNYSVPTPVITKEAHSPGANMERTPASYLEAARRSAPSAKPVRFSTSSKSRSPSLGGDSRQGADPIAKMFVECCSCKFYHDMPSKIYECMVHPEGTVEDASLGVHGVVTRSVKCPWCGHGMTTACCAGYAAVVYLKERLH